jgi:hypothetical protein
MVPPISTEGGVEPVLFSQVARAAMVGQSTAWDTARVLDEHEVVVQRIHRMGGSTIFAHGADRIASLLKASPEGEGVHPSQNATLTARGESLSY